MPIDRGDLALARTEADIAKTRAAVALTVRALEREITRTVDWREWIRRKPTWALALAFGLGFAFGRRN